MDKDVVNIYNAILAIKKNEVMAFAATWMDLQIIILSEVSQRQISYDITYMWNLKNMFIDTENNLWLPEVGVMGKMGEGVLKV